MKKTTVIFDFYGVINEMPTDRIDPSVISYIAFLKSKDFKIGIISNAASDIFQKSCFKQYPDARSLFDSVVLSSDIGIEKPELGIFTHALGELGVAAEEAVFVDDTKGNVLAAESLGMHGVHFTSLALLQEELEKYLPKK